MVGDLARRVDLILFDALVAITEADLGAISDETKMRFISAATYIVRYPFENFKLVGIKVLKLFSPSEGSHSSISIFLIFHLHLIIVHFSQWQEMLIMNLCVMPFNRHSISVMKSI